MSCCSSCYFYSNGCEKGYCWGNYRLTVRFGAFCRTRFYIFVCYVFVVGDLILRANDFSQPFQAFVKIKIARSRRLLARRRRVLSFLLDAQRRQVIGDRTPKMPQRHYILRLLRFGLLQAFVAHGLFVLVGSQHDTDSVLLLSFAR